MPGDSTSQPIRREILIVTSVDRVLRDTTVGSCGTVRTSVSHLSERNVPVVLVSHHSREELAATVDELGIEAPFIADNGAALCVPKGYFARLPQLSEVRGRWEVIEFRPPSLEDAIEMLMWLYRLAGDSPLLVGVGAAWVDHLFLRHVDVAVVVKSPHVDQRQLRSQFPEAYVTSATGPSGWNEAILGVRPTGADAAARSQAP